MNKIILEKIKYFYKVVKYKITKKNHLYSRRIKCKYCGTIYNFNYRISFGSWKNIFDECPPQRGCKNDK
jgi:hypothetical protein